MNANDFEEPISKALKSSQPPGKIIEGVSSRRQSRFERATRSLATFVRSHRSLRSLAPQRSASLRSLRSLAPFTGSLTHFAHSLVGQLKFLNMCSRCDRVSQVQTRFSSSLETRPMFCWLSSKQKKIPRYTQDLNLLLFDQVYTSHSRSMSTYLDISFDWFGYQFHFLVANDR